MSLIFIYYHNSILKPSAYAVYNVHIRELELILKFPALQTG